MNNVAEFAGMEFKSVWIESGDSWSHTFTKVGGFPYSVFGGCPTKSGTIIVVEDDEEQAEMMMKIEEWTMNEKRNFPTLGSQ
jgi:hypothetical protein